MTTDQKHPEGSPSGADVVALLPGAPSCDMTVADINVSMYSYHRNGSPYQRHCAFFEFSRIQEVLFKLGGMAGVW